MITVSISQLYNTSKSKTNGFLDEAYRRGKKVSSWLEFTEEDYNFLKSNFNYSVEEIATPKVVTPEVVTPEVPVAPTRVAPARPERPHNPNRLRRA